MRNTVYTVRVALTCSLLHNMYSYAHAALPSTTQQKANILPKGKHTLVFCALTDNFDVTWMEFTPYPPVNAVREGPGCA
jgi:hypothetical protein